MKLIITLLLFLSINAYAGYGQLSVTTGQMEGTGCWVDYTGYDDWTPAVVTWAVTQNVDTSWHYDYRLNVYLGSISHFILETSTNFTSVDMFNVSFPGTSIDIGTNELNPGNPYMPEAVYGIKFDDTQGTDVHIVFDSYRAPVWGDFYAKDGNVEGIMNTVWNSGFSATDPTIPVSDGTVNNHILVPDTIPEPTTLALLGLGAIFIRYRKY